MIYLSIPLLVNAEFRKEHLIGSQYGISKLNKTSLKSYMRLRLNFVKDFYEGVLQ